jgi:hypothetical protein
MPIFVRDPTSNLPLAEYHDAYLALRAHFPDRPDEVMRHMEALGVKNLSLKMRLTSHYSWQEGLNIKK